MIIDFFDAIDTMLTALFVWIIIGSAAATLLVLGVAALVWSAWKRAWRGVAAPSWARGRLRARILARRRTRAPEGHTDAPEYREAA